MEEGYIKYSTQWIKTNINVSGDFLKQINYYRSKLIKYGLIGKIPAGPGYGNISIRNKNNTFIITGSNTGGLKTIEKSHLSEVYKVDINKNTVWCKGFTIASSESMSHYAIYKERLEINSVIHIHNNKLWNKLKSGHPVTDKRTAYGTPELAFEIADICRNSNSKIIILGGHIDGILIFGETIEKAYNYLCNHL